MCELVNNFLNLMQPFILNIEEDYETLIAKEKKLDSLNNIKKIVNGQNSNFFSINYAEINDLVEEYNSNKSEYDANKYILESTVKEVKSLPQYQNAKKYFDGIYQYILESCKKLNDEYNLLKEKYTEKKIVNKYYQMFENDDVFVNDAEEIQELFRIINCSIKDKNEVLIYILKANTKLYDVMENDDEFSISEKEKILEIINNNKNLVSKEFNELLDVVDDYVDISKDVDEIADSGLINKINIANIVLAKKVWLYRKLKFLFNNMNYKKCNCIINTFENVSILYDKIKCINNQEEILRIIKGE